MSDKKKTSKNGNDKSKGMLIKAIKVILPRNPIKVFKNVTNYDEHLGENGRINNIKNGLQVLKDSEKNEYIEGNSFEKIMESQNLNEIHLKDSFDYFYNMFKIFFILLIIDGLWMLSRLIYLFFTDKHISFLTLFINLLAGFGFLLFAITNCLKSSMNCCSINKRKLISLQEWKKYGEYFPKKFKFKDKIDYKYYKKYSGKV